MLISFSKKINKNGVHTGSVLFCVFCLCLFFSTVSYAFEGKVRYVIDGDTFILENNDTVRIASIDTPEIGRDGKPDQYYAREAKDILTKLISGKRVRIEYTLDHKDHYKRIVGWVYLGSMFVNEYMIRKGSAFFYYHKNNQQQYQRLLLKAQQQAYRNEKGFWPAIQEQKKFKRQWVGNKRSQRCFSEGSKYARKINKRNRVYFSNLGQAFIHGYSPARNEKFWPAVK